MSDWLSALSELSRTGRAGVLVTVADTRGSTPREVGAKMVVSEDTSVGTVGGGQLEHKSIELARELLHASSKEANRATLRRFPLGPSLGQCCGGVALMLFERIVQPEPGWIERLQSLIGSQEQAVLVTTIDKSAHPDKRIVTANDRNDEPDRPALPDKVSEIARGMLDGNGRVELKRLALPHGDVSVLFEPVRPKDFHIVLFGAGHVGKSLMAVLAELPCSVTWVDGREELFPATVPANATVVLSDEPEFEVDDAPPGSFFLVMTHSHPLDQAICERVLRRGDFRYCGLIGSRSKRIRFEKRLGARGIEPGTLARMTCPIGINGVAGKRPAEIAIAVAAQLLQVYGGANATRSADMGRMELVKSGVQ
ncbi:MAG: xanthine dehydrogenase accessory protein XdhC [Gammaproteobacteria bacterium]